MGIAYIALDFILKLSLHRLFCYSTAFQGTISINDFGSTLVVILRFGHLSPSIWRRSCLIRIPEYMENYLVEGPQRDAILVGMSTKVNFLLRVFVD
jgi:hypothetical protein